MLELASGTGQLLLLFLGPWLQCHVLGDPLRPRPGPAPPIALPFGCNRCMAEPRDAQSHSQAPSLTHLVPGLLSPEVCLEVHLRVEIVASPSWKSPSFIPHMCMEDPLWPAPAPGSGKRPKAPPSSRVANNKPTTAERDPAVAKAAEELEHQTRAHAV